MITFHILKLRLKWSQISVVHSKITNEVFELGPVYAPIELNDKPLLYLTKTVGTVLWS